MDRHPIAAKLVSLLGMLTLGDALAFALSPRGHENVWRFKREPGWYKRMIAGVLRSRSRAAGVAAVELGVGVGLALASRRLAPHR